MPSPVILSRPEKTVNGFVSKWNAGGGKLPIIYAISNTKFPVNSEDTPLVIDDITEASDGNAIIDFASNHSFVDDQYILIDGDVYNGVFRVKFLLSLDSVQIDAAFIAPTVYDDLGDAVNYYSNYQIGVAVYAGIDSAHPLTADNPIELVSTINQQPNASNIANVDVSQYVKTKLSRENGFNLNNDYNLWADFYIEFYEQYELVRGIITESAITSDSENVLHSVNNVLQFKNQNGGNLAPYVASEDVNQNEALFLTNFEELSYFDGIELFDFSVIVEDGEFDLVVEEFDLNGNMITFQSKSYSGESYGVYRLNLNGVSIQTNTDYLIVRLEGYKTLTSDIRINIDKSLCITLLSGPINLMAESITDSLINLSWEDQSQNEFGFIIERSLIGAGVGFVEIGSVGPNVETFTDTGLTEGTTYFYRVKADGETDSAYSNEASATTLTPFASQWDTSNSGDSDSQTISLPLLSSGAYNFTVDWGDGNLDTITSWNQSETSHSYSSSGVYNVKIYGLIQGWSFSETGNNQDPLKIVLISRWQTFQPIGINVFLGCSNLNVTATDLIDLSQTNTLQSFFSGCSSLVYNSSIDNWDVSGINSLFNTFNSASLFNQSIDSWNVSAVLSLVGTFNGASAYNQDMNTWDVSSVTDLSSTFRSASAFNSNISSWDVSSVITMSQTFRSASSFNQNIGGWTTTSLSNMFLTFNGCFAFNQNLDSWNVSAVTTLDRCFTSCSSLNQPFNSWNVGMVTDMNSLFSGCVLFNQNLNSWDVSSAIEMQSMFNGCSVFNGNITSWVPSSATTMSNMFQNADVFNQDIGGWNTGNITSTASMFQNALAFNQDLSAWDVGALSDATTMFSGAALSTTNYDLLLVGWEAQTLQSGVVFSAGTTQYTLGGSADTARTNMILFDSWIITDGGGI